MVQLALLQASLSLGFSCSEIGNVWLQRGRADEEEAEEKLCPPAMDAPDRAMEEADSTRAAEGLLHAAPSADCRPEEWDGEVGGGSAQSRADDGVCHTQGALKTCRPCSLNAHTEFWCWVALLTVCTAVIWLLVIVYDYSEQYGRRGEGNVLYRTLDIDLLRSIALAPYGALLRYSLWHVPVLTPYVIARLPGLKVPTLTANILGTLFLSLSSSIEVGEGLYSIAFNEGEQRLFLSVRLADVMSSMRDPPSPLGV